MTSPIFYGRLQNERHSTTHNRKQKHGRNRNSATNRKDIREKNNIIILRDNEKT